MITYNLQGTTHFKDSLLGKGKTHPQSFSKEENPENFIYTADELKEVLADCGKYTIQLTIFHEIAKKLKL